MATKNTKVVDEKEVNEMKDEMPKTIKVKEKFLTKLVRVWNGKKWVRVTVKTVGCAALVVGGVILGKSGLLDGIFGAETAEAVVEAGADVI